MSTIPTDAILESISDGVFTIDLSWHITSFNRAAERITGIDRSDAIGLRCSEVFKSNMCEEHCPLAKTLASGKEIVNQQGYIVNLTGRRVPVSVSTAVLKDEQGNSIGGAETFRDLSEIEQLKKLRARERFGTLSSNSPSMQTIIELLPSVAHSSSTVLILGESGTGKEVLARTIHSCSRQKQGPFVALNCGALPDTLLESELFGYRKGAFTGADKDKLGRFALARGGTLFLDEIGDISPTMQVKLLRVLQEQEYEPLGAQRIEKSDARIICATNRNLERLVQEGSFRKDLYYRIHIIALTIPPLRERREDIPLLAEDFLTRYAVLNNKAINHFDSEVYKVFYQYSWPGNIRELENVVERAVVLSNSSAISLKDLPQEMVQQREIKMLFHAQDAQQDVLSNLSMRQSAEREILCTVLSRHRGKVSAAADELGMHRSSLYRKIRAYHIAIEDLM